MNKYIILCVAGVLFFVMMASFYCKVLETVKQNHQPVIEEGVK